MKQKIPRKRIFVSKLTFFTPLTLMTTVENVVVRDTVLCGYEAFHHRPRQRNSLLIGSK
jgi:hypothetical protein